jgi:hypothetical protein
VGESHGGGCVGGSKAEQSGFEVVEAKAIVGAVREDRGNDISQCGSGGVHSTQVIGPAQARRNLCVKNRGAELSKVAHEWVYIDTVEEHAERAALVQ